MDSDLILFIVLVIITIILIVVLAATKLFKPRIEQVKSSDLMIDQYRMPSLWSWIKLDSLGNPILDTNGKPIFDTNKFGVPVDRPDGQCTVYTHIPTDRFLPTFPLLNRIDYCLNGGCTKQTNNSCVDIDQIQVIKKQHICTGNTDQLFRLDGKCLGRDGTLYNKYEIEEYWDLCDNYPKCSDKSFGIVTFGDIECIRVSDFLSTGNCSLTDLDRSNNSVVLIRFDRANYVKGEFVPAINGSFLRLVHRPSGKYISPVIVNSSPDRNDNRVILIEPDFQYKWYLSPEINGSTINEKVNLKQYLTYVTNIDLVPVSKSPKEIFNYLVTNRPLMIRNVTGNGLLTMGQIIFYTYNNNDTRYLDAVKSSVNLIDYSSIKLIE